MSNTIAIPSTPSPRCISSNETSLPSGAHGPLGGNLFVFHIPIEWDETCLRSFFAKYGNVITCRIQRERVSQKSRGFGFVCYEHPRQAWVAMCYLHDVAVSGSSRCLRVQVKKDEDQYMASTLNNYSISQHCPLPNPSPTLAHLGVPNGVFSDASELPDPIGCLTQHQPLIFPTNSNSNGNHSVSNQASTLHHQQQKHPQALLASAAYSPLNGQAPPPYFFEETASTTTANCMRSNNTFYANGSSATSSILSNQHANANFYNNKVLLNGPQSLPLLPSIASVEHNNHTYNMNLHNNNITNSVMNVTRFHDYNPDTSNNNYVHNEITHSSPSSSVVNGLNQIHPNTTFVAMVSPPSSPVNSSSGAILNNNIDIHNVNYGKNKSAVLFPSALHSFVPSHTLSSSIADPVHSIASQSLSSASSVSSSPHAFNNILHCPQYYDLFNEDDETDLNLNTLFMLSKDESKFFDDQITIQQTKFQPDHFNTQIMHNTLNYMW